MLPEKRDDWFSARLGVPVRIADGTDRSVLQQLTDDEPVFPHPTVSLTHSGSRYLAVRTEGTAGVGIDYEPWHDVDPRTARFFLTPGDVAGDLLRMWTVKEALFKATADNAGCVLTDFTVLSSSSARGPRGECYIYATADLDTGPLTLAVRMEELRD